MTHGANRDSYRQFISPHSHLIPVADVTKEAGGASWAGPVMCPQKAFKPPA